MSTKRGLAPAHPRIGRLRNPFLDRLGDEPRHLGRGSAGVVGADRQDGKRDIGEEGDQEAAEAHRAEEYEGEGRGHGGDRAAEGQGGEGHALRVSRRPLASQERR